MPSLQPTPRFWHAFDDTFRFRVHELLVLGFRCARPRIEPSDDEPNITSRIVEAINHILDTTVRDRPVWYDLFDVPDNPRTPAPGKLGKYKPTDHEPQRPLAEKHRPAPCTA